MTATESSDSGANLYDDKQASAASGIPLPSLRVLQAMKVVRSQKIGKAHGGYRRAWSEREILKARVAASMNEHFALNFRIVSEAMSKFKPATWDQLVTVEDADITATVRYAELIEPDIPETSIVMASSHDWHLELVDRKYLFLKARSVAAEDAPEAISGQSDILMGIVQPHFFLFIPWDFDSPARNAELRTTLGADNFRTMDKFYRGAMTARGNFLSKSTINGSMQVRMAWHRLRGRNACFIQDLLQFGKGDSE